MLWIKALHIIVIICWFAGIFYLPRLFVYHALATEQATRDHLKIMERKLYRFTTPFALLTVLLGLWLTYLNWHAYRYAAWFYWKMSLVIMLLGYHHVCGRFVKQLATDQMRSPRYYRWFNELPVLLLLAIVILAVVKPF